MVAPDDARPLDGSANAYFQGNGRNMETAQDVSPGSTSPVSQTGIPLQNFGRNAARSIVEQAPQQVTPIDAEGTPQGAPSSWHTRGRQSLGRGSRSFLNPSSINRGPHYSRISETSPSPMGREERGRTTSRGDSFDTVRLSADLGTANRYPGGSPPSTRQTPGELGPQVGLTIDRTHGSRQTSPEHFYRDANDDSQDLTTYPSIIASPRNSTNTLAHVSTGGNENDTTPLTHPHNERQSRVHFTEHHLRPGTSRSRLGDDLRDVEEGRLRPGSSGSGRGRSLSPTKLNNLGSRAGTIMRKMSQRVVNLSNEPEMLEQTMRREPSSRGGSRSRSRESRLSTTIREQNEPGPSSSERSLGDTDVRGSRISLFPKTDRFFNKSPSPARAKSPEPQWRPPPPNPLKGKSFGLFGPENKIRKGLCEVLILPATEPIILLLILVQTVLLAVEASLHNTESYMTWGTAGLDDAFIAIFSIYTLEILAKSIVSGFLFNAEEYSTLDKTKGWRRAVVDKARELFIPQSEEETKKADNPFNDQPQVSILRSITTGFATDTAPADTPADPAQQQRMRLARRAFLRHSFNRLDFIAVVSFWISFILEHSHIEASHHIYVFRMMSCLRILRLLFLTTGTSAILLSLKKAAPMVLNVSFLMGFFWLLFAIVGVQSFKSSLLRTCVWVDPMGRSNYTMNDDNKQYCGGFIDSTTNHTRPWIRNDGIEGNDKPKGYICPRGSLCVQGAQNPYEGTLSFDDIGHSLEAVFVIMSSNTFTDILYYTTDSDYLVASLFFIAGYVILALWLVSLLVAVITSSFQIIREESHRSAFANAGVGSEGPSHHDGQTSRVPTLKKLYDRTTPFWAAVIVFDLSIQGLRAADMGPVRANIINVTELVVTFVLLGEIIFRFVADVRGFHRKRRNWFDLGLAIITCIIQIPAIKHSDAYMALTIFQILRVYRVVLGFVVTKDLVPTVLKNAYGLINLILFVFMVTFLAAIFAIQLFKNQIPDDGDTNVTFGNIYNSFLGMYQILSSENWTDILYSATQNTVQWNTAWISAIFIIIWFMFANLVVLNMFIAVIQESFDISEEDKRLEQMKAFIRKRQMEVSHQSDISLSNIFGFKRKAKDEPLDRSHAPLDMLSTVVEQFFVEEPSEQESAEAEKASEDEKKQNFLKNLWRQIKNRLWGGEPNPFYERRETRKDMHLRDMVKEVNSDDKQRKQAKRRYLEKYPNYNTTLFMFKPTNRLRRLCQRVVGPVGGRERFDGVEPIQPLRFAFSTFIYASIVAMVIVACIVSPLYQRKYYTYHGLYDGRPWFIWTDIAFAILFTVEVFIKVVADGFYWTPNAYFRGTWGLIDGMVLVTMWINVATSLTRDTSISRVVGAFRALRALRLLNLSTSARETFHAVIIKGWWKVTSAAFVSLSLLIPFAIYGVNLFNGKLEQCNDDSFTDVFGSDSLEYCIGEYMNSPFNWDVLTPRVVSNPWYSFDTFPKSLFILFQIVSQEGWIDVMYDVMGITGAGKQPQDNTKPANGLFFIAFNLLGAVFVLTLFMSVFMRNYTEETGVAFLTSEQRSWLEFRKILLQISPSKRPIGPISPFKRWCYRAASQKHGKWARFMTVLLCFHLVLLVVEFYPQPAAWETVQDLLFLLLNLLYIANIVVRIIGLSWSRFSKSSWDLFSIVAVTGSFITTLLGLADFRAPALKQLHKLFLVSVTFLLIPRNNQLDQLFKMGAASIPSITSMLATWFVLFLTYGIAMTQIFGLTKFGDEETTNINFRDVPRALILLFRTSCGEGWNEIMEDFATMSYPNCTPSDDYYDSDCGSLPWARALFISWNLISMYIFVSLFVSVIFENFSYVYQRSSDLYTLSREEIRAFKEAWAAYDPAGTGFISKEEFPRFLGELTGKFEMGIYFGDFTVSRFVEDCTFTKGIDEPLDPIGPMIKSVPKLDGNAREVWIDLGKLNRRVNRIPLKKIQYNRAKLKEFCEDVLVDAKEQGVSFSSCIMTLVHYNIINEWKSMKLEELLRRLVRKQRVQETVRRNTVQGFINMWILNRRYREKRDKFNRFSRMTETVVPNIPEIFVNDGEDSEPSTPRAESPEVGPQTPMLSPPSTSEPGSRNRNALPRLDTSVASVGSPSEGHSSSLFARLSNLSPSLSPRFRSTRDAEEDVVTPSEGTLSQHEMRDVIASLGASAWGESMRRSMGSRRSASPESHSASPRSPR